MLLTVQVHGGEIQLGRHLLGGLHPLVGPEPPDLGDELFHVGDAPGGSIVQGDAGGGGPGGQVEGFLVGEGPPQGFGDERHGGVQEPQEGVEHIAQDPLGDLPRLDFRYLQVPVAEFVPGELVQGLVGLGKLVAVQVVVDGGAHLFQAAEDPLVGVGEVGDIWDAGNVGAVHEGKPGGVEEFGGEVPGALGGVGAERQVHTRVGAAGEGEAERVGTVFGHPVHGVDAVAQRLAHLPAVFVAHQAVEE